MGVRFIDSMSTARGRLGTAQTDLVPSFAPPYKFWPARFQPQPVQPIRQWKFPCRQTLSLTLQNQRTAMARPVGNLRRPGSWPAGPAAMPRRPWKRTSRTRRRWVSCARPHSDLLPRIGGRPNSPTGRPRSRLLGAANSGGEVEFVPFLPATAGAGWSAPGSDHTDRRGETYGVTVSQQMCDKAR